MSKSSRLLTPLSCGLSSPAARAARPPARRRLPTCMCRSTIRSNRKALIAVIDLTARIRQVRPLSIAPERSTRTAIGWWQSRNYTGAFLELSNDRP